MKELHVQPLFEDRNAFADECCRGPQLVRRGSEATAPGSDSEQLEVLQKGRIIHDSWSMK
jgi:hypothetical protein